VLERGSGLGGQRVETDVGVPERDVVRAALAGPLDDRRPRRYLEDRRVNAK